MKKIQRKFSALTIAYLFLGKKKKTPVPVSFHILLCIFLTAVHICSYSISFREVSFAVFVQVGFYDLKCTKKPDFLEKSGFCSVQIQI